MLEPSDELVGLGEELYSINCVSCHGAGGRGDGPKGAGLNPPPRNFASGEQFKQGGGTLQLYQTLNAGVPGSSMASFSFLNARELMALSHYVRFLVPSPTSDPPELVAQLAPAAAAGAPAPPQPSTGDSVLAGSAAAGKPQDSKPGRTLPVAFVVERILADQSTGNAPLVNPPIVYKNLCADCHGKLGEGAPVERVFPQAGTVYVDTRPLSRASKSVIADSQTLAVFLASGLRGQPGHRFPDLTAEEVGELLESLIQVSARVKQQ